jgi:hypothetical protein
VRGLGEVADPNMPLLWACKGNSEEEVVEFLFFSLPFLSSSVEPEIDLPQSPKEKTLKRNFKKNGFSRTSPTRGGFGVYDIL